MILKSLSILGFKSFADRVRLAFGEGITAIVGPNGSGKSNIADAIQWVLGEQNVRALRADNSTEVIFAGSAGRKPLGMAEVSLTVDNSAGLLPIDFAEVTVTRRLYRSGESEYLINKTPCRLKDIVELFMDTGLGRAAYAILTQNEVDIVLSAKPEDRRALFEEAAGIQKYRHRKREALRKLENTEANLTRVYDILIELEAQRDPLRQQAEAAIRYHQLVNRLREIEVSALWAQVRDSELAREQTLQEQQNLHRQLLHLNAQMAECESLSKQLGSRIAEVESDIDTLRALQQASLTAYERAESRRALIEQRLQSARDNLARLQEEIAENDQRLGEVHQQAEKWQERRLELQQRIEQAEHEREIARERLQVAEHALQMAQQHYVQRTQQVAQARAHLESLRLRRAEVEQAIETLHKRIADTERSLQESQERYRVVQAQHEKAVAGAEISVREVQRLESALQQAQAEVQREQQKPGGTRSRERPIERASASSAGERIRAGGALRRGAGGAGSGRPRASDGHLSAGSRCPSAVRALCDCHRGRAGRKCAGPNHRHRRGGAPRYRVAQASCARACHLPTLASLASLPCPTRPAGVHRAGIGYRLRQRPGAARPGAEKRRPVSAGAGVGRPRFRQRGADRAEVSRLEQGGYGRRRAVPAGRGDYGR